MLIDCSRTINHCADHKHQPAAVRVIHVAWPAKAPCTSSIGFGYRHSQKVSSKLLPTFSLCAAVAFRRPTTLVRASRTPSYDCNTSLEDYSLDRCLQLLDIVRSEAAQQASSHGHGDASWIGDGGHPTVQKALQILRQRNESGDLWLLVRCADWAKHPDGWSGPAYAVLQLRFETPGLCDYFVHAVNPSGWPNGKCYASCSELENLTTKVGRRKFGMSIKVLSQKSGGGWEPRPKSLRYWMSVYLGDGVKLVSKRGIERATYNSSLPTAITTSAVALPERRAPSGTTTGSQMNSNSSEDGSHSDGDYGQSKVTAGISQVVQTHFMAADAAAGVASYRRTSMQTAAEAAAAAVAAISQQAERTGPPAYILSDAPGPAWDTRLHMDEATIRKRFNIIKRIKEGKTDMSETHVTLEELLAVQGPAAEGGSPQVYDMEQLSSQAEAAAKARKDNQELDSRFNPHIPDPHKPFTITLDSGKDGRKYVVAHYEPRALQTQQSRLGLLLSHIYHTRPPEVRMGRTSAPEEEEMVMCGLRMPRKGGGSSGAHFGRYAGDTGPEGDQFSCVAWPYLMTTGALPAISGLWAWKLPVEVNALNKAQSQEVNRDRAQEFGARVTQASFGVVTSRKRCSGLGSPANFPAPCLLGSPFTTLAVTHNYKSHLHAEPGEHSFNFITWQDVLSPGSVMTVGHFWLTAGLAFTPLPGSALYIDVRVVSHKSDPCTVHNGLYFEEGRYGAALFIKPPVLKSNAKLWSLFDWSLEVQGQEEASSRLSDRSLFGIGLHGKEVDSLSSVDEVTSSQGSALAGDRCFQ